MTNQWTFIGECIKVDTKPAGRANVTTAILRRVDGDAETTRETLAAAEIWNARGPAVGDVVVAWGTVVTREYQGRYYTSLRCERWHRIALAEPAPRQQQAQPPPARNAEHQTAKADAYQPQQETTRPGAAQGEILF